MVGKYFLILALAVSFQMACALETIVDKPVGAPKGLVVIAPAKTYLMNERLFSELARQLKAAGYTIVRFNWSPDTLQTPGRELQRAARDINYVLKAAQYHLGFRPAKTVLISKSFSTKALESSLGLAQMQILLTPNCSLEAPFRSTYASMLARNDIKLRMIISAEDPYCSVEEIRQTLRPLGKLALLGVTAHGDHNFTVRTGTTLSYQYQDQVIRNVVTQIEISVH